MSEQTISRIPVTPSAAKAPRPLWRRLVFGVPRRLWQALFWGAFAVYVVAAVLILVLRYSVLPNIESYRGDIERLLSEAVGLQVSIEALEAHWHGLHPYLGLRGLQVLDAQGSPVLGFERVDTELSWRSVPFWELRLHRLDIARPTLAMRREPDGRIFVGGVEITAGGERGAFSDWVLRQSRITIADATIHWEDARRAAPPLTLSDVDLRLENDGSRHRFSLTASPPQALAARLDVRGDLRGRDLSRIEQWRGEAYAALEYADLAGWRAWIDYPLELPRGSGALRTWLKLSGRHVDALTADVALRDVRLRLAPELPMLDLPSLSGRLTARLPESGFEFGARRLTLETRDGGGLAPSDFDLRWTPADARKPARGDFSASTLDLEVLARLAAHLPLDETVRRKLADFAPRGRLSDLKLHWGGPAQALKDYAFRGRFEGLALQAQGVMPGFAGLSGSLSGTEKGGSLTLAGREAALDLPAVFPEPRLALGELAAQASWSVGGDKVDVDIQNASFNGPDAAGNAFGRYRYIPGQAGEIDIEARLTRAEATSAWRYMPHAVSQRVRDWLRFSLLAGHSGDARLHLKGDLKHFPFIGGKPGVFHVTGKFNDVTLRYAEGWPEITGLNGDLLFEGERMLIQAPRGTLSGVALSGVRAEIPQLVTVWEEMLGITGRASGATQDFLSFIEASPVGEHINHFTREMSAEGGGALRIGIGMNLRALDKTKVEGEYQFADNRIQVDPAYPPLTAASGKVQFTDSGVTIRGAQATLLDTPLAISAQTLGDGGVVVEAQGSASMATLGPRLGSTLSKHLSGAAALRGSMTVLRGRPASLSIDSDLVGVASTLPEPLNKSAAQPLPLHFERTQEAGATAEAAREVLRVKVGEVLGVTLVRRREGAGYVVERGGIGVREPAPMPERGVALAVNMPRLDLDAWRRLSPAGSEAPALRLDALSLRAGEVRAFGHSLNDLNLRASLSEGVWQAQVASREASGEVTWHSQGEGRLRARLKQLVAGEAEGAAMADAQHDEVTRLPGLDVVAESFSLRGKPLGRLELLADNHAGLWRIDRLALTNPDASFAADGQWRTPRADARGQVGSRVDLNFKLDSGNAGKLLERLGYADALRRGTAKLEGRIGWAGVPTTIDYPSLEGSLSLEAKSGQFNKLDPGVGRLLGVLSLQSLPRRITLDFRDVFSEGFAFDTISGSMTVSRGIMETSNFVIQGPAAKVQMSGKVDIAHETQDLRVRVQPTLSETVAIGAAIANPVAGLATLLAQKVLRDPIEQMFAYDYAVTGKWADPKVDKVQLLPPQQTQTP